MSSKQVIAKSSPSQSPSVASAVSLKKDLSGWSTPDFIYGGPFIKSGKPDIFLDTVTPINIQLQGTFKKSFAYYSLKERLPVILTKVIDYASREGSKKANTDDIQFFIKFTNKLKSDLMTNKKYDPFTHDSEECKKWNQWLENLENSYYFTNTWVFTECYVYRKLREACELRKSLENFDPFEQQKTTALNNSIEIMCTVADRLVTMLPPSEKDKRKADFITLLKICLWANKCDLSLSAGEQVSLKTNGHNKTERESSAPELIDPFQMIVDFKDKLLVDDSAKAADQVVAKAENMAKAIEVKTTFKFKCSCHRLATLYGVPILKEPPSLPEGGASKASMKGSPPPSPPAEPAGEEEAKPEAPQIPCPAKMTLPQAVIFDIVCDNSGYELFADVCLAHFLVSQNIVQKVRFHVKKMPWFVSDATPVDFKRLIETCLRANYKRELLSEPKPEPVDGTAQGQNPPKIVNSDNLNKLAQQWQKMYEEGTFLVMCEDFWTYPHVYKDMKTIDYNLYRKLQYAVAILFKGDLNYRKLLAERNCNPVLGFEAALQGFTPAPIIAVRTVKADLICGLPRGKWDQLTKADDKWMQTGDYGVIQFCGKAEPLKVSDRPCIDYGDKCFSNVCPVHDDL